MSKASDKLKSMEGPPIPLNNVVGLLTNRKKRIADAKTTEKERVTSPWTDAGTNTDPRHEGPEEPHSFLNQLAFSVTGRRPPPRRKK